MSCKSCQIELPDKYLEAFSVHVSTPFKITCWTVFVWNHCAFCNFLCEPSHARQGDLYEERLLDLTDPVFSVATMGSSCSRRDEVWGEGGGRGWLQTRWSVVVHDAGRTSSVGTGSVRHGRSDGGGRRGSGLPRTRWDVPWQRCGAPNGRLSVWKPSRMKRQRHSHRACEVPSIQSQKENVNIPSVARGNSILLDCRMGSLGRATRNTQKLGCCLGLHSRPYGFSQIADHTGRLLSANRKKHWNAE